MVTWGQWISEEHWFLSFMKVGLSEPGYIAMGTDAGLARYVSHLPVHESFSWWYCLWDSERKIPNFMSLPRKHIKLFAADKRKQNHMTINETGFILPNSSSCNVSCLVHIRTLRYRIQMSVHTTIWRWYPPDTHLLCQPFPPDEMRSRSASS